MLARLGLKLSVLVGQPPFVPFAFALAIRSTARIVRVDAVAVCLTWTLQPMQRAGGNGGAVGG